MASPEPQPNDFVFGPIMGGHDVDLILYGMIEYWIATYLREIGRRAGMDPDELKPFRSYRVSHELEKMPEDQTPGLIIVNEGLVQNPTKVGSGKTGSGIPGQPYGAVWQYQLGSLVAAKGKKISAAPRANTLAKMYTTAVRLIMIQKRGMDYVDPRLGMIDWIDEGYDGLDSEDDRTIALHHADFYVATPAAAAWATGPIARDEPDVPGDPDIPLWPLVTSADVDVIKVEQDVELPDEDDPLPQELGGE